MKSTLVKNVVGILRTWKVHSKIDDKQKLTKCLCNNTDYNFTKDESQNDRYKMKFILLSLIYLLYEWTF